MEDIRGELEAIRGVREAEVYELKREVEGLKEELQVAWSQVRAETRHETPGATCYQVQSTV